MARATIAVVLLLLVGCAAFAKASEYEAETEKTVSKTWLPADCLVEYVWGQQLFNACNPRADRQCVLIASYKNCLVTCRSTASTTVTTTRTTMRSTRGWRWV
jgi:hypothetical protein